MTQFATNFDKAHPFPDVSYQFALAANTELTQTIPGNSSIYYRVTFSWPYNANVWVGYKITATSPSAGTMSSCPKIELRPDIRYVRGGDVLHFVSNAIVTDAGFSLLQLPN